MKIRIVDFGVGNLHSALKALRLFCDDASTSEDPAELRSADALVLPGVGSFRAGMHGLQVRGLGDVVREAAEAGKPILGICLGAQLLLSEGQEFGRCEGLGIIPGEVVPFPPLADGCKVPHMGWSPVDVPDAVSREGTILEATPPGADMYFVHSFLLRPQDHVHTLAVTSYGGHTFASVIRKGNVYGCQFHPEKSGAEGLRLLERFASICAEAVLR
ncbi:MAG: imidazole glycerol phosphate synthase subunit HisH [Candidatus Peribacteraceae bacterium]|nr:imidazole glycerol phosphate synthase subunit HisH [Candidatus Peribacteraceae bacterium]